MNRIITRKQAIALLDDLLSFDHLDENFIKNVEQIQNCIDCEMQGAHVWGIPEDEYTKMKTEHVTECSDRELTETEKAELKEKQQIIQSHIYMPSAYERQHLDDKDNFYTCDGE